MICCCFVFIFISILLLEFFILKSRVIECLECIPCFGGSLVLCKVLAEAGILQKGQMSSTPLMNLIETILCDFTEHYNTPYRPKLKAQCPGISRRILKMDDTPIIFSPN